MAVTELLHRYPRAMKLLIAALAVLSIILIYYPGLHGDYEFDDTVNIRDNPALKIDKLSFSNIYQAAIAGGTAGPLKRPISMATFALNRVTTGVDPYYMKLTNVIIHITNAVLLYFLSTLLLQALVKSTEIRLTQPQIAWIAFAAAFTWAIHPLTITSNLVYVILSLMCKFG